MAELSRHAGVGIPMIKYYLRQGMLPAGERTGAPNQASYSEAHVRRLRLLRALTEDGGLTAAAIERVLAAVDSSLPLASTLGVAQDAILPAPELPETDEHAHARAQLSEVAHRLGWHEDPDNPGWRSAVHILATCHRMGHDALPALLGPYAEAMNAVAAHEVDAVADAGDRDGAVESAVTVIALGSALLNALRVMAQQQAALRRLGPGRRPTAAEGAAPDPADRL
ncbi:MerR family transcriptional regulator [Amycolatopsis solani]|uniref:MerR family transcriptional regulator n=1 Tax=Amycolatopsis solani TaxID=3028615 RepID=UPI0025B02F79|nr:MerR family transcriptional regulator [Amycolatopsis sp. MEP2-6]